MQPVVHQVWLLQSICKLAHSAASHVRLYVPIHVQKHMLKRVDAAVQSLLYTQHAVFRLERCQMYSLVQGP